MAILRNESDQIDSALIDSALIDSAINDKYRLDSTVFDIIASDIENQGFSIQSNALPQALSESLYQFQQSLNRNQYKEAGIGRGDNFVINEFIRTDEIFWITDKSHVEREWLDWTSRLQNYLNRRLFLGLKSFESHFAHYGPGDYYKKHLDAFKGQANRVLTVVCYLNPDWSEHDGGELVLYKNQSDNDGISVRPMLGTCVVFLSEDFPHEVLPSHRDRFSIAGWFRASQQINHFS